MPGRTHLTRLTFASIDQLADGQAADAVNLAIERCLADLDRFGADGQARKVVVEVGIKRRPTGRFVATFAARAVLPGGRTKVTTGYVEKEADTATGLFAAHSAGNPDQLTLPLGPEANAVEPSLAPTQKKGRKGKVAP
ncbi:unnamed protein product [Gemmataceae bacterium]|nr:unnamed protein product [Gemmataceae bacterium]VTT96541.1 unnamed protein product [Gemmataceae bacterium]